MTRPPRLEDRRLPFFKLGQLLRIGIIGGGREMLGHASRCNASQMPQALNANTHLYRASVSQGWVRKYRSVRTTPSLMLKLGDHPSSLIRCVSKKMKGLSPIHPRSPPENSNFGFTFNSSVIH